MKPEKILIYGGCHALVLRDMLLLACEEDGLEIDLLVNFDLIRTGRPFPYADLKKYDAVLYSPVENKDGYNTVDLRARCDRLGLRAICFPWLEWHGYCPGALKGSFKGRFQWFYPELETSARGFKYFDDFFDHVVRSFPSDDVIDRTIAHSTAKLRGSEERNKAAVNATDFIADHFRQDRLFLISDHASLSVYKHVAGQLLTLLGYRDRLPRLDLFTEEPQWRWRTPIFPRVASRLDLAFEDESWVDDELLPGRTIDLRTYLGLYFHPRSVILGPLEGASLFTGGTVSRRDAAEGAIRFVMNPLTSDSAEGVRDYLLLETLSGPRHALAPNTRVSLRQNEWRSEWAF